MIRWSCALEVGTAAKGVPMEAATRIPPEALDRHLGSESKRSGIAPDLSSPELCRQKAEECLNLSYQIPDPKGQVAVLKLANWWKRLAENYYSRTATRHKAS